MPSMAERVGFEPTVPLVREHAISNRAYSATLAPLLISQRIARREWDSNPR